MMLADSNNGSPRKRSFDQDRGENEDLTSSRDAPSPSRSKTRREPEQADSPPGAMSVVRDSRASSHKYSKTASYASSMDTDSPASYPKHVIVPSPPDSNQQRPLSLGQRPSNHFMDDSPPTNRTNETVVTPILTHERQLTHHNGGYGGPPYRPPNGGHPQRNEGYGGHGYYRNGYGYGYGHGQGHGHGHGHGYGHGHGQGHGHGHGPEMDYGSQYSNANKIYPQPKRWACDYCCVATFTTFEEACSHEEACANRYGVTNRQRPYPTNGPPIHPQRQQNGGLGTLYQATQEVHQYSPRMQGPPHYQQEASHSPSHHSRYPQSNWGNSPPQIPSERTGHPTLSPRFQDFRMYDDRQQEIPHHRGAGGYSQPNQRRMLLATPADADSLSDRQCYVRSDFVEVFAATEKDVSARHSKGAQKLMLGQVGIRCMHCSHLRPKDRAERAVCYPSSISRIYQTVADMQRFHFEQCREIHDDIRKVYKSLKTTRPRGVGSPQTYWIHSAKLMNLADTEEGIRFEPAGPPSNQQAS